MYRIPSLDIGVERLMEDEEGPNQVDPGGFSNPANLSS